MRPSCDQDAVQARPERLSSSASKAGGDADHAPTPADGQTENGVSIRVLGALLDAVEEAGVPRAELLNAASRLVGKRPALDQLEVPEARVAEADIRRFCELALDLSGDPALGLHWAERLTVDTFVPLSYLVTHAATLGQALESLRRFAALMVDEPAYRIVEHPRHVTMQCVLRATDADRIQRFMAELTVFGFIHVVRCFHARWLPEQVSFEYPAPAYRHEYARVFACAERFEQPYTGISFDRAFLDKASLHKDEGIHASLQELAEQRLGRIKQRAPYGLLVREQLVQNLARSDMASVSAALGLSARSLRRRLAAEGKSYTDIANEAFSIVTRRLLLDEARTIQETAYALGFSGTTAFHRAFKRATGLTPRAFVDTQLGRRRR